MGGVLCSLLIGSRFYVEVLPVPCKMFILSWSSEVMPLDLTRKRHPVDAQLFGSLGDVPVAGFQAGL